MKGVKKHGFGEIYYGVSAPVIHTGIHLNHKHQAISYKGHFENDLKHGKGIETYNNLIYNGKFDHDQMKGHCNITWTQEKSKYYYGHIENGLFHGRGRIHYRVGVWVESDFVYGKIQGNTIGLTIDGSKWKANINDNQVKGWAQINYIDGSKYQGDFVNMAAHGYGEVFLSTGDYFQGNFREGLFNGPGLFDKINSYTYKGAFRDGLPYQGGHIKKRGKDSKWIEGIIQNNSFIPCSLKNSDLVCDLANVIDMKDFVGSVRPKLNYKKIIKIKIGDKLENEMDDEEREALESIMAIAEQNKPFKYHIKIQNW